MSVPEQIKAKKEALEAEVRSKPEVSEVKDIPKPEATANPEADADQINLSRAEYTDLRAAADKSKAAEGRVEALQQDIEALRQHLTELETPAKAKPDADATGPTTWNLQQPSFTSDEEESYGESKEYIQKVVRGVLADVLPAYLKEMNSQLATIKTSVQKATDTVSSVKVGSFTDRVRQKVSDFDSCVENPSWAAFVQAAEPTSGMTYADLIRHNLNTENLVGMTNIFDEFKRRYRISNSTATTGYEGAMPNGTATKVPPDSHATILKFSDRKAAHDKYLQKEISFEDYQKIKHRFDEADKLGQIDYAA